MCLLTMMFLLSYNAVSAYLSCCFCQIQIEIIKGRENMDDEGTLLLSTSLSSFSKVSRKKILQQVRIFCGSLFRCSSLNAYS